MYKMVMIDLDGTLLNDKKQVSKRNVEMIQRIQAEKNVLFVITTGKNINDITQVLETIGDSINQYIIASNGAIIKDNVKQDYLVKKYIGQDQILKMIDIYKKQHLKGIFHTHEIQLTDENEQYQINQNTKLVENLKKYYLENEISTTSMISLCGNERDLKQMKEKLKVEFPELDATDICHFIVDRDKEIYETKYIDIMKKDCTKANAIKILADHLDINKEEIIVIGDGANDISMFEMSGYKIAMGNANDKLKEKADYITDSNNQDGVAKALEEIFYKGENIA